MTTPNPGPAPRRGARERLCEVIFEHTTTAGRVFDGVLIAVIIASVAVIMLDSVQSIRARWAVVLYAIEWAFTILFSIEYVFRVYSARDRLGYVRSFFGVVDLLSILPTYASLVVPGSRFLVVVRIFRVLRVFRVLKLAEYLSEAAVLQRALKTSRPKILVFIFSVLSAVIVVGALMYLIEGPASGFTSIPRSVYWAIVTLTTVGYGDIAPQTVPGQILASLVMVLGFGIIAVPTGILTVELGRQSRPEVQRVCMSCGTAGHTADAVFCRVCAAPL